METELVHQPAESPTPTNPTRIALISSSVRDESMGRVIAGWVRGHLKTMHDVVIDVLNLAEIDLPDDQLLQPGGGPMTDASERVLAAQAFVVLTPEYNHSYPASLKRFIDWHYAEWALKPATIVGYGVHGGYAAIEHLRGVFAELSVVTTRRCLGLAAPWNDIDDGGRFTPGGRADDGLDRAVAELRWWSDVLTDPRETRPFPG